MSAFHPIMTPELQALRRENAQQLNAVYISVAVVTSLVVVLRLWARWTSKLHFGWDDVSMIAATVFMYGHFAVNLVAVKNGLGLPPTDLFLQDIVLIRKCLFSNEILYLITIALTKFSILIMYCRIFALRSFRIAAWILGGITLLWLVIYIFIYVFQCSSIDHAWNSLTLHGRCLNLRAIFVSNALINIVTDVAILMMPLYHVWRLQMRLAQRVTLMVIFMLGCFVVVSSVYRFVTVLQLSRKSNTHDLKEPMVWSHIEICTAIVCGCLPWMRPLLIDFLIKIGLSSKSQSGPHSGQQGTIGLWRLNHTTRVSSDTVNSELAELGGGGGGGGGGAAAAGGRAEDSWSERRKNSQSDVLTLHSITVTTTFEQSINQC